MYEAYIIILTVLIASALPTCHGQVGDGQGLGVLPPLSAGTKENTRSRFLCKHHQLDIDIHLYIAKFRDWLAPC
jgi:hypothetical protein